MYLNSAHSVKSGSIAYVNFSSFAQIAEVG